MKNKIFSVYLKYFLNVKILEKDKAENNPVVQIQ